MAGGEILYVTILTGLRSRHLIKYVPASSAATPPKWGPNGIGIIASDHRFIPGACWSVDLIKRMFAALERFMPPTAGAQGEQEECRALACVCFGAPETTPASPKAKGRMSSSKAHVCRGSGFPS